MNIWLKPLFGISIKLLSLGLPGFGHLAIFVNLIFFSEQSFHTAIHFFPESNRAGISFSNQDIQLFQHEFGILNRRFFESLHSPP